MVCHLMWITLSGSLMGGSTERPVGLLMHWVHLSAEPALAAVTNKIVSFRFQNSVHVFHYGNSLGCVDCLAIDQQHSCRVWIQYGFMYFEIVWVFLVQGHTVAESMMVGPV